ncbi:MAG: hypothetical protein KDA24_26220, partial [Deltaproteobacteria bacterium]|nr:hypothetical protein [Deltaproteobacteria bacterium]
MSETKTDTRFCPVHGDYSPRLGQTVCPSCEEDPIASRASLRSVKVITAEMAAIPDTDSLGLGPTHSDEHLTTIDDIAKCPSCGNLVPLETFQSEAVGEVWEGEAALWAEDGVCRNCYRDVLPANLRRWTTEEWVRHHFEGWKSQVRKVHDVEVMVDSEHDSWLPGEERHRILDVEGTLSARREHLARAQMRLRELKAELELADDPVDFVTELETAREGLGAEARKELERRRDADLARETERRVGSVTNLSPAQALMESGLDPDELLGDLARSTGSKREIVVPDFADVAGPVPTAPSRWPLVV